MKIKVWLVTTDMTLAIRLAHQKVSVKPHETFKYNYKIHLTTDIHFTEFHRIQGKEAKEITKDLFCGINSNALLCVLSS